MIIQIMSADEKLEKIRKHLEDAARYADISAESEADYATAFALKAVYLAFDDVLGDGE